MKKELANVLRCPNSSSEDFHFYGSAVERDGEHLNDVNHDALLSTDEIVDGLLISSDDFVYPVRHGVLSILADSSVDLLAWKSHFAEIRPNCPDQLQRLIDATVDRLTDANTDSDGDWNRDEMRYYDASVDTEEKRDNMCHAIETCYLGRTYHTRKKVILDEFKKSIKDKLLLEIGCGTSRTIASLFRPKDHHYRYIGLDISFYRLVVAKRMIPEGEFVQASALDLPFQEDIADMGLAFGAIHHLPRPIEALRCLDKALKDEAVLGLHEPIQTPKLVEGKIPFLQRLFTTYEHSEHDGEISVEELTEFLNNYQFADSRCHFSITPFRTLTETCLRLISSNQILESATLSRVLHPIDSVFVHTIGRMSKLLGPRAVTVLAKRHVRELSTCPA